MTKVWNVGDRVVLRGSDSTAVVWRVNGDGTIDVAWDEVGYSCNRDSEEFEEVTDMTKSVLAMDRVELIKALYPVGQRIELIHMEDPQAPPKGTRGTVKGVDCLGDLLVDWDNGSALKAIVGEDIFIHVDVGVTYFFDEYEADVFCDRLRHMGIEPTVLIRNWGDGHIEYVIGYKEVKDGGI